MGVSQTAALNRGRHLYSAGRPSRWALAHILVLFKISARYESFTYLLTPSHHCAPSCPLLRTRPEYHCVPQTSYCRLSAMYFTLASSILHGGTVARPSWPRHRGTGTRMSRGPSRDRLAPCVVKLSRWLLKCRFIVLLVTQLNSTQFYRREGKNITTNILNFGLVLRRNVEKNNVSCIFLFMSLFTFLTFLFFKVFIFRNRCTYSVRILKIPVRSTFEIDNSEMILFFLLRVI